LKSGLPVPVFTTAGAVLKPHDALNKRRMRVIKPRIKGMGIEILKVVRSQPAKGLT